MRFCVWSSDVCSSALDLLGHCEDLLLIVMAGDDDAGAIDRLRAACPGRLWLGASMLRRGDDRRRLARLMRLGAEMRVPLIATNDALYATPAQRPLPHILTCTREKPSTPQAGRRRAK